MLSGDGMTGSKDNYTVKLPKEIVDLIKEMYDLPNDTSHKKVVLYAFSTLIPKKGRESFSVANKIDEKQIDKILNRREQIIKDKSATEFEKLNNKLDLIRNNGIDNTNEDRNVMLVQLKTIQTLIELLLVDNYSNAIEPSILDKLLESNQNKALVEYAKNKAKD